MGDVIDIRDNYTGENKGREFLNDFYKYCADRKIGGIVTFVLPNQDVINGISHVHEAHVVSLLELFKHRILTNMPPTKLP